MDTKKLRQKILDLAIHGKLVPQDPNDEPASVLLERIRAEKERMIAEGKIKRSKKSATSDTPHYENVPFEVPENWIWIDLNSICSKIVDGDHNPPSGEDRPTRYRMLSSKNINCNTIVDIDDCRYLSEQDWKICHSRTRLNKGDVLLTTVATLGRSCVVETDEPICFQRSVTIITTLIYNKYLKYIFDSNYYQELMTDTAKGTAQKGFYINQVSTSIIPLPPLAEQMRIVHAVSQWISFIDSIESSTTDLFQSIQSAKAKILDLAIHGKLVPHDANDEPASELLKRINPEAVASCDNPHYENLPNGWAICSVKDIAQVITGSTPSKSNSLYYGNDVPFYKPNDLDCGRHIFSSTEYLSLEGKRISRVIPCNSISICCIGSIGKVGYIEKEGVTNQQINTIIPSSEINPLYIYYYCLSERFQQNIKNESSAVTIAIVNKSKLEKLSILLPPILEQRRIVEKIEQLMSSLDSIAETLG